MDFDKETKFFKLYIKPLIKRLLIGGIIIFSAGFVKFIFTISGSKLNPNVEAGYAFGMTIGLILDPLILLMCASLLYISRRIWSVFLWIFIMTNYVIFLSIEKCLIVGSGLTRYKSIRGCEDIGLFAGFWSSFIILIIMYIICRSTRIGPPWSTTIYNTKVNLETVKRNFGSIKRNLDSIDLKKTKDKVDYKEITFTPKGLVQKIKEKFKGLVGKSKKLYTKEFKIKVPRKLRKKDEDE